jgi:hypothetical protein
MAPAQGQPEDSMRHQIKRKQSLLAMLLVATLVPGLALAKGPKKSKGLSSEAIQEIQDAGMDKYLGEFTPISSEEVGDGWTKHTFDSAEGDGPVCIDGSPYSMFTRNAKGKNKKGKGANQLLIMLQGGGACWQFLTQCSQSTAEQEPPFAREGIWDFDNNDNPFDKHAVAYLPYCDGSVFVGDNTVIDPFFDSDSGVDGERQHRGLRNLSAGLDVARATFEKPKKITVAGSSAGGVGAANFTPFLVRLLYGNKLQSLTVFNDAGPLAYNTAAPAAAMARENDWKFSQFYPASCSDCTPFGNQTALVQWRLDNDNTIREAQYQTDADGTNIGFSSLNVPGSPFIAPNFPFGLTQNEFRDLTLDANAGLNDSHPKRYKRFIVSGDRSHTALQTPLLYTQDANGVILNEWTKDFLKDKKGWKDIVENFVAAPPLPTSP